MLNLEIKAEYRLVKSSLIELKPVEKKEGMGTPRRK